MYCGLIIRIMMGGIISKLASQKKA